MLFEFQLSNYAPTVVQTISNPDGTVSIIQVDPSNPIITLPDGTTAHVQVHIPSEFGIIRNPGVMKRAVKMDVDSVDQRQPSTNMLVDFEQ